MYILLTSFFFVHVVFEYPLACYIYRELREAASRCHSAQSREDNLIILSTFLVKEDGYTVNVMKYDKLKKTC